MPNVNLALLQHHDWAVCHADTTATCAVLLPQLEDFDDGVVHQLNAKRTEDEAIAAVRHIAHYELGTIQHMAGVCGQSVSDYSQAAVRSTVITPRSAICGPQGVITAERWSAAKCCC